MSDYLGSLVERSFARISAVRPAIPSRFEPTASRSPVDNAEQIDLPFEPKPTALSQHQLDVSLLPTPAQERFIRGVPATPEGKKTAETPAPFSSIAAIPAPPLHLSLTPAQAGKNGEPPAIRPRVLLPGENVSASVQVAITTPHFPPGITPATVSIEPMHRRDGSRPASSAKRAENRPPLSHENPAPSPTIQVTIGRIEIKATPPAPAPSPKAAKGNPGMSLENYLQRRAHGGRNE